MFDFSRVAEVVGGLMGGGNATAGEADGLGALLENVGLDPSVLEGLSGPEIAELLQGYGIDPSQVLDGQLSELIGGLSGEENLSTLASSLFGENGRG